MDLFTVIDDAVAIVRTPRGVLKQTKMYRRGERVFVPHSGGYVRIVTAFDGVHGTSAPDLKVVEFDAPGVIILKGEPRWSPSSRAKAA